MTDFTIPEEVVQVALCAMQNAEVEIFGETKTPNNGARREAMKEAIATVLPLLFDQVYQQEVDGYWSDQPEAVKNWWDGRKTAPQFRIVYRIKDPK